MNRSIRVAGCVVALVSAMRAAQPDFTQSLQAADFAAAGLNKLSPAERARLDALVRQFKAGSGPTAATVATDGRATSSARPGPRAANAPAAAPAATEAAAVATPRPAVRGTITVAPGTKVEYSQVESRIAGEFSGWDRRTIFTLENGQRWQADASTTYVGDRLQNPAVKIAPGMLGTYWMTIEGVKQRVKVKPLGQN